MVRSGEKRETGGDRDPWSPVRVITSQKADKDMKRESREGLERDKLMRRYKGDQKIWSSKGRH
jgi:hypothetical protein